MPLVVIFNRRRARVAPARHESRSSSVRFADPASRSDGRSLATVRFAPRPGRCRRADRSSARVVATSMPLLVCPGRSNGPCPLGRCRRAAQARPPRNCALSRPGRANSRIPLTTSRPPTGSGLCMSGPIGKPVVRDATYTARTRAFPAMPSDSHSRDGRHSTTAAQINWAQEMMRKKTPHSVFCEMLEYDRKMDRRGAGGQRGQAAGEVGPGRSRSEQRIPVRPCHRGASSCSVTRWLCPGSRSRHCADGSILVGAPTRTHIAAAAPQSMPAGCRGGRGEGAGHAAPSLRQRTAGFTA